MDDLKSLLLGIDTKLNAIDGRLQGLENGQKKLETLFGYQFETDARLKAPKILSSYHLCDPRIEYTNAKGPHMFFDLLSPLLSLGEKQDLASVLPRLSSFIESGSVLHLNQVETDGLSSLLFSLLNVSVIDLEIKLTLSLSSLSSALFQLFRQLVIVKLLAKRYKRQISLCGVIMCCLSSLPLPSQFMNKVMDRESLKDLSSLILFIVNGYNVTDGKENTNELISKWCDKFNRIKTLEELDNTSIHEVYKRHIFSSGRFLSENEILKKRQDKKAEAIARKEKGKNKKKEKDEKTKKKETSGKKSGKKEEKSDNKSDNKEEKSDNKEKENVGLPERYMTQTVSSFYSSSELPLPSPLPLHLLPVAPSNDEEWVLILHSAISDMRRELSELKRELYYLPPVSSSSSSSSSSSVSNPPQHWLDELLNETNSKADSRSQLEINWNIKPLLQQYTLKGSPYSSLSGNKSAVVAWFSLYVCLQLFRSLDALLLIHVSNHGE